MTDENNPFKIALKNISNLKESIVLFSCLLQVEELNKPNYFSNGDVSSSFLYLFLNKKYSDYYEQDIDFLSFFELCKKTNLPCMDLNYILNHHQIIDHEHEDKNIFLREKILKSKYHSQIFKKAVLKKIDTKLLIKDKNFDSIIISFAKNNEIELIQYLIDEKIINVNDYFKENQYIAPVIFYINSYVFIKKFIQNNTQIDLALLAKKTINKDMEVGIRTEENYINIFQKVMVILTRNSTDNIKKKNKEVLEKFKDFYLLTENKVTFSSEEKNINSLFNLFSQTINDNPKIYLLLLKNIKYKKLILSKNEYVSRLILSSFQNNSYEFIQKIFKNKIEKIFDFVDKEDVVTNLLFKSEKIKKYNKTQIKFIDNLLKCSAHEFLNDDKINHNLMLKLFKKEIQNVRLRISIDENNIFFAKLDFDSSYQAKENNIIEIVNHNIEYKKLDLENKYFELDGENYLQKLFYESLNGNDNLNEFFFYGNKKENSFKGFIFLSEDRKIDFFKTMSDSLYIPNFYENYKNDIPNFNKNKIINIKEYQAIRKIAFSLSKMIDGFNLSKFPSDFYDKEATIYLKDTLRDYVRTLNNYTVVNNINALESNIEKIKLEAIINDKNALNNKRKNKI